MAYLNSDDVLLPGSLARVARFFSEQPRVDLVYSHRIIIDEDDLEVGRWVLPPHDPSALRWADYVPQETMFWRRSVWERLGGLDESLAFAMDWDFILRAQEAGFRLSRLSTFLACFRIHSSQKTTSLSAVGEAESAQLRRRYLGYNPSSRQVTTAIRKYLYHHALLNRLHRASLLTYG